MNSALHQILQLSAEYLYCNSEQTLNLLSIFYKLIDELLCSHFDVGRIPSIELPRLWSLCCCRLLLQELNDEFANQSHLADQRCIPKASTDFPLRDRKRRRRDRL